MFVYTCLVLEVHSGDTLVGRIDLGFGIYKTQKLKLYGVIAPPIKNKNSESGIRSKEWLSSMVLHKNTIIKTYLPLDTPDGDFYYCNIFVESDTGPISVNDWMLRENLVRTNKKAENDR